MFIAPFFFGLESLSVLLLVDERRKTATIATAVENSVGAEERRRYGHGQRKSIWGYSQSAVTTQKASYAPQDITVWEFDMPSMPADLVGYVELGVSVDYSGASAAAMTQRLDLLFIADLALVCSAGQWAQGGVCQPCPTGGYCHGDERVYPQAGYWSSDERTPPSRCSFGKDGQRRQTNDTLKLTNAQTKQTNKQMHFSFAT